MAPELTRMVANFWISRKLRLASASLPPAAAVRNLVLCVSRGDGRVLRESLLWVWDELDAEPSTPRGRAIPNARKSAPGLATRVGYAVASGACGGPRRSVARLHGQGWVPA